MAGREATSRPPILARPRLGRERDVGLERIDRTALLERAYEASREWLASGPRLTESAVHGDFHSDNLLTSDRCIVAVVDWEFARIDWPASDLAAAVVVLSLQQDGMINERVAEETVTAYVDSGGRDESHELEPLMRQFLLAVALHGRTRKAAKESWSPEFQGMIEAALKRFV